MLVLPALAGCTRPIEVKVEFVEGQPVLTFYTEGLFPRRLDSICLWSAEIIDDISGRVASKLLASDYEWHCTRVPHVTFNRPEPGLIARQSRGLVPGRPYHVEVIADEGMGKSETWRQP